MSTGYCGRLAREPWHRYRLTRYAALEDPRQILRTARRSVTEQYQIIRDGLFDSITPMTAPLAGPSPSTGPRGRTRPPAKSSAES